MQHVERSRGLLRLELSEDNPHPSFPTNYKCSFLWVTSLFVFPSFLSTSISIPLPLFFSSIFLPFFPLLPFFSTCSGNSRQRQQQQQHRFRTGWRASLPGGDWLRYRHQLGSGRELLRAGPADPRVRFPQGWRRGRRGGDRAGKKHHPVTLRFIASSVPLTTGLAATLLLCHQTHIVSTESPTEVNIPTSRFCSSFTMH